MTRAVWLLALTAACSSGVSPRVHQARLDALDSLAVALESPYQDTGAIMGSVKAHYIPIDSWWRRHEEARVLEWPEYRAALAREPRIFCREAAHESVCQRLLDAP